MAVKNYLIYEAYLVSDVWKCCDSPTNAHHWKQVTLTAELANAGWFVCKYCGEVKKFQVVWQSPQ